MSSEKERVSLFRIFGYALGEGAVSITLNAIGTFAMLYCTLVLGLSAAHAGMALSVTLFWDAVTDPVMGHISDNTRSRFGRRHPYLLAGGILTALFFVALWIVPSFFSATPAVFWLVLGFNLLIRTAITVYAVPYVALGFELCPEYQDRSRLQGVRFFVNQAMNLTFNSCAMILFFGDRIGADGVRIDGTTIGENYVRLGITLGIAIITLAGLCIFFTRKLAQDNRQQVVQGNNLKAFRKDLAGIFSDRLARYIFGFLLLAQLGMMLTAQMQMFTYIFFMELIDLQKTLVHATGAICFALGSLSLTRLVPIFDKKPVAIMAILVSISGGLISVALFSTGLVEPKATLEVFGMTVPYGILLFALGQGMWWGGCGMQVPLATSMMGDLSELNKLRTGVLKDGGYASVFTFFMKFASSIGLLVSGWMVSLAGIEPGAKIQTAEAIRNVSIMTFLCGPAAAFLSLLILWKYPVTRNYMEQAKTTVHSGND